MSRRKPCGVCAAASSARSTASTTAASATRLIVSMTGSTGSAPTLPASIAATTRSKTAGGVSARAASWTSTISTSPHSAASPRATDSCRVAPPVTTDTRSRRSPAASSASVSASPSRPCGATMTTCAERTREDPRQGVPQDAVLVDADERLRTPRLQAGTRPGGDDDDGDARDGRRFLSGVEGHAPTLPGSSTEVRQDARTSSRTRPACSSSVFSASASSEIRI